MPLFYRIAADVVVTAHFAFVAFVIIGQLLILAGAIFGWAWIRNFRFRALHLASILVVVLEALGGVVCPLTSWEQSLRALSGSTAYTGDFIPHLLHEWLFYEAEGWV